MKRFVVGLLLLAVPDATSAREPVKDVAYAQFEAAPEQTRLDVYPLAEGSDHPVLIYIHGGGWRKGDKVPLELKPKFFNDRGFVLVSANYRLYPIGTFQDQATDLARAIRWTQDHAREHGGSPDKIYLIGHSAGAHLAALVATDPSYLGAERLKLDDIKGVVLLDGAAYNVPRRIEQAGPAQAAETFEKFFSTDEATQKKASPIHFIAKGQGIPPFLVVYVVGRPDSPSQSKAFAARLKEAEIRAELVPAEGKTHVSLNTDVGRPGDAPTKAILEFLDSRTP